MTTAQKPFLSYDEQIALLEQRGLIFTDKTQAKHFLRHIGYSHLKSYWLSCSETSFKELIDLYCFDAVLKNWLMQAFLWIEPSIRHSWIICLSDTKKKHHPLSYYDKSFYRDSELSLSYFRQSVHGSKHNFIEKYQNNKSIPPIWKMAEILTFGGLSKTIRNLKKSDTIAKCYHLEQRDFTIILQRLVSLRNKCAHQHIIWNHTEPTLNPKLTKSHKAANLKKSINAEPFGERRVYNSLCFCLFLLRHVLLTTDYAEFYGNLKNIIKQARPNCATFKIMGFPQEWENTPLWR